MRNGDRVRADVIDMGRNFALNVNGQERQVPIGDIVLIDFAGDGRNVTADELSKANAANGRLRGDAERRAVQCLAAGHHRQAAHAVFSNGRRSNIGDVARIYLGSVSNVPGFPTQSASNPSVAPNPPNPARPTAGGRAAAAVVAIATPIVLPHRRRPIVVVPSNVQWTNTGINVQPRPVAALRAVRRDSVEHQRRRYRARRRGARVSAVADKAPIPTIPVGALIGRVNNGQPFSIGDTTHAFDMPANGRLFLGVNDDHVPDNSGNFVVKIWEP